MALCLNCKTPGCDSVSCHPTRTKLAIWLEATFRECPRPTEGRFAMSEAAHKWEDADWERLAQEARQQL
jgi:hypothetical protein